MALLGILLVNIAWYIEGPMSRLDLWVARAVELWFSGKFYPLFAMLLGVGVHPQSRRFGSDFLCTFSRCLIILALIGLSFCLLIED